MKVKLVSKLRNKPIYLDMYLKDKKGTKLPTGEVEGWGG